MAPEQCVQARKAFGDGVSLVKTAQTLGVAVPRIRQFWVQEFGAEAVKDRGNKARGRKAAERRVGDRAEIRKQSLLAFRGELSLKNVAKQLGVASPVVRRWWVEEFSETQLKERAKRLHLRGAKINGKARQGTRLQLEEVDVQCSTCNQTFQANRISLAKSVQPTCHACKTLRALKKNPQECPVCSVVCEGKQGLAIHFGWCEDEKHQEYQSQILAQQFEGQTSQVDFVTCAVCGFLAKSLSSHIRVHGLNWQEYARQFPGSSLWSDATYEHRNARIQETHSRLGLTHQQLAPFLDEGGFLVVAAAAKGLKAAQDTIRRYAKLLEIPTRNRLAEQKRVLDLVSKSLGEMYRWEWSDDRIRNPETGWLLYFDGYFPRHNLVVEYHGPQHFQFVPKWHRVPEEFDRQRELDKFKARRLADLGVELVVVRHSDPTDETSIQQLLETRVNYRHRQEQLRLDTEQVLKHLRQGSFPFPVRSTAEHTRQVLAKLQNIRQTEKGGIIHPRSYTGNACCRSYFPNIYSARRLGHPTAVECWESDLELRKAIVTQLDAGHPTTPERVLKALTFHHRLPAVFRPAFARFIYERYCRPGGLVWDPCSGYGGRLMGAAVANVRYLGTDIEPETVAGNQQLAQDLGIDAEIRCESALDAELPNVDLVFTSPPYFDLEQYSDRVGQPHVSYENQEDWVFRFLSPLVVKSLSILNPGGFLVLVLPEVFQREVARTAKTRQFEVHSKVGFELPNGKISQAVAYVSVGD